MSGSASKPRRQFRNVDFTQLRHYRLPLAGKVSILHRISGVLLFLALPIVILPLFDMSLRDPYFFMVLTEIFDFIVVKLILLVLIWAYLHHFCAGIRFLLLDVHVGINKYQAAKSAASVLVVSLLLTLVVALKLFGVF